MQMRYNHTHGIVESVQSVSVEGDTGAMNTLTVTTGGLFSRIFGTEEGDTNARVDRLASHEKGWLVIVQLYDGRKVMSIRPENSSIHEGQKVSIVNWRLEPWRN